MKRFQQKIVLNFIWQYYGLPQSIISGRNSLHWPNCEVAGLHLFSLMSKKIVSNNVFAAACYDTNSAEELNAALRGMPDETDMREWGLSPAEWRKQIHVALEWMRDDRREA